MKKNKKFIRRKIEESRGEYKKRRRKKFLYLKNTEQFSNHLDQKKNAVIPKTVFEPSRIILPKWYQRFFLFLKKLLKWKS